MEHTDRISGKRILLGVTGSIAAYKAVDLVRRLSELGAEVRVAMTGNAGRFVSKLTFEALSRGPVLIEEFDDATAGAIGHIRMTENLDLAVVAPATANIIGKIAAGIADDALTSALMAAECPLLIAPAMNDRMYRNPRLQRNIAALKDSGVGIIGPGTGSLACGATGRGRLADVDLIIGEIAARFAPKDLAGRTVLVTAGPTREFIDAVRFISNPSTGKMGYALASAARDRGANVILITGPTQLPPPSGVRTIPVVSAADMQRAVREHQGGSHIVIMAAAVSDFRPRTSSDRKVKKSEVSGTLDLEQTEDILEALGQAGGPQVLVGFAAETDDIERNALRKLRDKNLDLIVVNDLLMSGSGFGTDTNAVVCIDRSGKRTEVPTMQKALVADRILDLISPLVRPPRS